MFLHDCISYCRFRIENFKHAFIVNAVPSSVLRNMIDEARAIAETSNQENMVDHFLVPKCKKYDHREREKTVI